MAINTMLHPEKGARAAALRNQQLWNWIGVAPFFVFAFMFLLLPSSSLFVKSFLDTEGHFTLDNIAEIFRRQSVLDSYWLSIRISAVTAIAGGIFGFFLAFAVTNKGIPSFIRPLITTFSGVASNFAGVPLAFAFIATLGRTGLLTVFIKEGLGIDLYQSGFNLYGFAGLSLTYLYFQFPLMLLIMAPALEGLRKEWREATENLGATGFQYWWYVGLPILLPSLLGTMLLLFGNAFGAYATAYALTGGTLNIITISIGAQIRGDVLHNVGLGNALGLGMVVIMTISIGLYSWLQRRSERWLR
jgi:putative spermidine/putrescine transport system permease protein